jgi:hypothetical protein
MSIIISILKLCDRRSIFDIHLFAIAISHSCDRIDPTFSLVCLEPIAAKNLPDMGFADWFIGSFALSMLLGGLKMIWFSFFVR